MSEPSPMPAFRYAGFWVRAGAYLVDLLILVLLVSVAEYLLLNILLALSTRLHPGLEPSAAEFLDPVSLQIMESGLLFCLAFPYYSWCHFRWGATPGKRLFHLQVVSEVDGGILTLGQAILRFFSFIVSHIFLGAGFVVAAFHSRKKSLHDLTSRTVVIHAPQAP